MSHWDLLVHYCTFMFILLVTCDYHGKTGQIVYCLLFTGWWFGTWLTWLLFSIIDVILPLDELIFFKIVIAPPASLPHWVFHIACDLQVIWCKILPAWDTWEYDPATKQNLLIAISLWSGHKPKTPRLILYVICNMYMYVYTYFIHMIYSQYSHYIYMIFP